MRCIIGGASPHLMESCDFFTRRHFDADVVSVAVLGRMPFLLMKLNHVGTYI